MNKDKVLNDLLTKFDFYEAANIFYCYPNKSIDITPCIEKFKKLTVIMYGEMEATIKKLSACKASPPSFIVLKRQNLMLLRINGCYELWYSPVRYPNTCKNENDEGV